MSLSVQNTSRIFSGHDSLRKGHTAPGAYLPDGGFVPWEECHADLCGRGGTELEHADVPDGSCLVIPEGIVSVGTSAFRFSSLSAAVFPFSLRGIGFSAFGGSSVKQVSFPPGLCDIAACAFSGSRLVSVYLPAGIIGIGGEAFAECRDLVSVSCDPLTGEVLGGDGIFADCVSLVSVSVPPITGRAHFRGCRSGLSVNVCGGGDDFFADELPFA